MAQMGFPRLLVHIRGTMWWRMRIAFTSEAIMLTGKPVGAKSVALSDN